MKVVFVSNYYNHHQAPFSQEMFKLTNGNYYFIENEELATERKNMGWGESNVPSFVKQAYVSEAARQECIRLINDADVVLFENTTRKLVLERLRMGKLTFLYSERVFKAGYELWKLPIRLFTWHRVFDRYKNHYLLCASAYTAADFALTLNYINKAYKWGYFPKVNEYDVENLLIRKRTNKKVHILWTARLIGWKHPETPIMLAERLKVRGYDFELNLIGNGEREEQIAEMIQEKKLDDCVHMLGSMKPDEVRAHMEQVDIFLFTSDFNEGWGAVLNESMNSGCAVVASHAIGAVPFLVQDKVNGLIYKNGDIDDLEKKVEILIKDSALREKLGREAYNTMLNIWNAETAASRLLELSKDLLENGKSDRFNTGPCSKAERLRNGWYKG